MESNRQNATPKAPPASSSVWGKVKFQVVETVKAWSDDKASTWAAALAFYTMLSLGPLLFVVVAICGLVLGEDASRAQLLEQARGVLGDTATQTLEVTMKQANQPGGRGILATVLGIVTLVFGASGVFAALQEAMDAIWHVKPSPRAGVWGFIKRRFLSMTMILGVGFLLTVSLVMSSGLAAIQALLARAVPMGDWLALGVDFVLSTVVFTLFFSAMFKVLPDARVRWRDTWLGGAVTALLFNLGKILIGLYLARSNVTTSYGAAGSLALVLLWVYYAAQIVFFGGEFVRIHAQTLGSQLQPGPDAVAVEVIEVNPQDRRTA